MQAQYYSLQPDAPIVLYDDHCSMCTAFARAIKTLAGGRMCIIGHYSSRGAQIRSSVLESDALEMFWFLDGDVAYGGRAALVPLAARIIRGFIPGTRKTLGATTSTCADVVDISGDDTCTASDCSGVGDVFLRSASILKNSKTIHMSSRV